MESVVDLVQRLAVSDKLVNLQATVLPVLDETGKLAAALDTTESTALPLTTSDKLEWSCRDFCDAVSTTVGYEYHPLTYLRQQELHR